MINLTEYLLLGAVLFGIGIYGVLSKRSAVGVLMSVELMLNAVNINFIAVNKFVASSHMAGQLFAIFIIVVAAAEVAVGLALILAIFRQKKSVDLNDFNLLKW
ncbi:NADH-quinone oxidoreductase subunit NuoK [Syntrophomonas curvata]